MKDSKPYSEFWLFKTFAFSMGNVVGANMVGHDAMQLSMGINKALKVVVEDTIVDCKAIVIESGIPHQIDESGEGCITCYFHQHSTAAQLLRKVQLQGDSWRAIPQKSLRKSEAANFATAEVYNSDQILRLCEGLFYAVTGHGANSSGWSEAFRKYERTIESIDLIDLSIDMISNELGIDARFLDKDFFRLAGVPLNFYIYMKRLYRLIDLVKRGLSSDKAAEEAGFGGLASAGSMLERYFALRLNDLLNEDPYTKTHLGVEHDFMVFL